jgi:phage I-like protein
MWSEVKTIEIEEGVNALMPFVQTKNNKAYLVFYGVGKREAVTLQTEVSVYTAKINELQKDQKVVAQKIEGTTFKSKNSFLGDYIALGLFNQSDKEEGLIAFTTLINQKQTSIATVKIKF